MNSVNIIGRVVNTPELKNTAEGVAVTSFRIAVPKYKSDEANFFTVVAWRSTADFAVNNLVKGSRIGVAGMLSHRSYENKAGSRVYVVEIIADTIDFADGIKSENKPQDLVETEFEQLEEINIEDIPF